MNAPARREAVVGEVTTLLGRGSEFEGKLTFEGNVHIAGKLKGEVFSDGVLTIEEGAYVEAEIDIGEVIIQGKVVGNIRATGGIEINATGQVKGDLTTPALQIDKGAIFEGRSFMEEAAGKGAGKKPVQAVPSQGKSPDKGEKGDKSAKDSPAGK